MWRLIYRSKAFYTSRCCFLRSNRLHEILRVKIPVRNFSINQSGKPQKHSWLLLKCTAFSGTLAGGALLKIALCEKASCNPKNTRLVGLQKSHSNVHFEWKQFWSYLKPHIWYFVLAIAGALAVAVLNIQIPHIVGSVIDVLAKFSSVKDKEAFFREMKMPALKLIFVYLAQSACTFSYIYMLSNIGEKIAYQMKTDLFSSIIEQDIAFFDQHRTGEIINRLTADVQDFKSSFKQIVSGGLRASTQIIGCITSLVIISPQMTMVTLLCVPSVIALGTVFGAALRAISRAAQAQVKFAEAYIMPLILLCFMGIVSVLHKIR